MRENLIGYIGLAICANMRIMNFGAWTSNIANCPTGTSPLSPPCQDGNNQCPPAGGWWSNLQFLSTTGGQGCNKIGQKLQIHAKAIL